jgi:hypothetical protein
LNTTVTTEARNASLPELMSLLQAQHDVRYDVVADARMLRYEGGVLVLEGQGEAVLSESGVTCGDVRLHPTAIFEEGISDKLGIPQGYVRRMRSDAIGLLDTNVNHWLQNGAAGRKFLVRGFRAEGMDGIARAFLSDRYRAMDALDAVVSTFTGIQKAGYDADSLGAITGDLTERFVRIKVQADQVATVAPELLRGYRSPFSGNTGTENPMVHAGLDIRTSETGGGALVIAPTITVQVCNNGMTITKEAFRKVHLGGVLDAGAIDWSGETHRANQELIAAQAADAVAKFLNVDWLKAQVAKITEEAAKEVDAEKAPATIERVGKALAFSEQERAGIMGAFIKGGQLTAGGVMQAITAHSQELASPERAAHLEDRALEALALV